MFNRTIALFLQWAELTVPATPDELLLKFKEEAEEFLEFPTPFEAADVVFCVLRYCHAVRWNLSDAMARKFDVLLGRRYERMPDGTWHHVEEPA